MRVLIADDEPDVRIGLKNIINWNSLGFDICGEAANGLECLEKMQTLNPDLVLLDIRMPKMHGLECVKTAREKGWNGKIIILSGYSDFQYAQTAIQCGVDYYLLKPIDENELKKSVEKLRDKIEAQRCQSQKMNLCFEKARSTVLQDFLSGRSRNESYSSVRLEQLGLDADCYQVVISDGTDQRAAEGLIRSAEAEKDAEAVRLQDKTIYLLKGSRTIERLKNIRIKEDQMDSSVFLALGNIVMTSSEIYLSCKSAESVLNRKFFFGRNQIAVEEKDLPQDLVPWNFKDSDIQDYVEKLFSMLQAENKEGIKKSLEHLEENLSKADALSGYIADFLINVYMQVKHKAVESYGKALVNSEDKTDVLNLFGKHRLYEIIDGIREGLCEISREIENVSGEHVVDRMIRFIDMNYGKNLKLENIAVNFGYNSAYLGKKFKAKTGESFNNYLDRVRIKKATELLRKEDLKICEISKKVGYENIDYFYFKFHKYLSQSPMEYRKNPQEV